MTQLFRLVLTSSVLGYLCVSTTLPQGGPIYGFLGIVALSSQKSGLDVAKTIAGQTAGILRRNEKIAIKGDVAVFLTTEFTPDVLLKLSADLQTDQLAMLTYEPDEGRADTGFFEIAIATVVRPFIERAYVYMDRATSVSEDLSWKARSAARLRLND